MAPPSPKHLRLVPNATSRSNSSLSDEALMSCVAESDTAAFSQLIDRYQTTIFRFCSHVLKNRTIAEEVTQDVFLKLWEYRTRYRSKQQFRSYVYTIALNRCRSLLRKQKILSSIGLISYNDEPSSAASSELSIQSAQMRVLLRRSINRLPDKYRVPLILRFVEEMDYETISTIIGRNPSTVRSRVHYGLKALSKSLPQEIAPWNE